MERCAHITGRVEIVEETVRITRYELFQGGVTAREEKPLSRNLPGKVHVTCKECGFKKTFDLHSTTLPKWLTLLLIRYMDHADEDLALIEERT